ncbi:hypothetical protein WJX81_006048 [Elliptochloris bilobata]|uniref:Uncharacterized protein n=1 Tax=Elliptochloris bilobata TaxID=381761 RepID=A0AAW1RUD8_9CHLO
MLLGRTWHLLSGHKCTRGVLPGRSKRRAPQCATANTASDPRRANASLPGLFVDRLTEKHTEGDVPRLLNNAGYWLVEEFERSPSAADHLCTRYNPQLWTENLRSGSLQEAAWQLCEAATQVAERVQLDAVPDLLLYLAMISPLLGAAVFSQAAHALTRRSDSWMIIACVYSDEVAVQDLATALERLTATLRGQGSSCQAARLAQVMAYTLASRKSQLNAGSRRAAWGPALRALRNCSAFTHPDEPSVAAWREGGAAAKRDMAAGANPQLRPREYRNVKIAEPGPESATEALCAGLAVELRLALANQHSSTFRYDPVLLAEDEAAAAEAFAAWPATLDRKKPMTNLQAHARVAHTQLAGYVARRLRDPEASAAPSDLGLLARLLWALVRSCHDCAATRDLLSAISAEVRWQLADYTPGAPAAEGSAAAAAAASSPTHVAAVLVAFHALGYCPDSATLQAAAVHLAAHRDVVPADDLLAASAACKACGLEACFV